MKDIRLTVDELVLHGKLFSVQSSNKRGPGVLLIHGWESVQDRMFELAKDLSSQGYTCMTFDLRGHGASEGDHKVFSRKDFFSDVVAAYDFLVSQPEVDGQRIFAIGSSFGGYLTALLAAERLLRGAVLRVPADYSDEGYDKSQYEQVRQWGHSGWRNQKHSSDETAALRAVHVFQGNILIVESEKDEIVPCVIVRSYKEAAKTDKLTYVVMKGAPHSISRHPEYQKEFSRIVSDWLSTNR